MSLIYGRKAKPWELVVVVALATCVFVSIYIQERAEGISEIEVSIEKKLGVVTATSPSLKEITLDRKIATHWGGSGTDLTGYFQYEAHRGRQPLQLIVRWKRELRSASIVSIEGTSDSGPYQLLWSPSKKEPNQSATAQRP